MRGPGKSFRERMGFGLAQVRYWPRTMALVWAVARRWTLAWIVLLGVQGVLPVVAVMLTRRLVNELVRASGADAGRSDLRPLLLTAAGLGAVMLLGEVLRGVLAWVRTIQSELFKDHIQDLVQRQSASLDLAAFDSPAFHDRLHRVRYEASSHPAALLDSMGGVGQNAVSLAAMGALLLQYGPWIPLLLLLSALPALAAVLYFSLRQREWRQRVTADERRSWYCDWLLTHKEPAAELRLFGLSEQFRQGYRALRERLRGEGLRLSRRERLAEMAAGAVALLAAGWAFALMAWRTLRGAVTLGDLAMFVQAFLQGQQFTRALLSSAGRIYHHTLFLGDLFEFLDLRPAVVEPPPPGTPVPALRAGIRFRGVTFRYPGTGTDALRDFDLSVPAGRITAVVGPNGAGKSTLIKLLCRFYDPDAGRIEWDGVDMKSLRPDELRAAVSALFQSPMHYSATVAQNIGWGDPGAESDGGRVEAAARVAGADEVVARLAGGYSQSLGTWFPGGVELSVGEWQRLALARALVRPARLVLLDEPTSAMDSWAEAEWLQRLRPAAAGRTVVIITHRFTTAMQADTIHVMDRGRIVESGTHAELLGRAGLYARSWAAQAPGRG